MSVQEPLVGADLIAKVKAMPGASKSELVKATGYVSTKKDGGERLNFTAYYEALAMASGAPMGEDAKPRGRQLGYRTTVLTTGALVIGKRYLEQLELAPGDELSINVDRGRITLLPVCAAAEEQAVAA